MIEIFKLMNYFNSGDRSKVLHVNALGMTQQWIYIIQIQVESVRCMLLPQSSQPEQFVAKEIITMAQFLLDIVLMLSLIQGRGKFRFIFVCMKLTTDRVYMLQEIPRPQVHDTDPEEAMGQPRHEGQQAVHASQPKPNISSSKFMRTLCAVVNTDLLCQIDQIVCSAALLLSITDTVAKQSCLAGKELGKSVVALRDG